MFGLYPSHIRCRTKLENVGFVQVASTRQQQTTAKFQIKMTKQIPNRESLEFSSRHNRKFSSLLVAQAENAEQYIHTSLKDVSYMPAIQFSTASRAAIFHSVKKTTFSDGHHNTRVRVSFLPLVIYKKPKASGTNQNQVTLTSILRRYS